MPMVKSIKFKPSCLTLASVVWGFNTTCENIDKDQEVEEKVYYFKILILNVK